MWEQTFVCVAKLNTLTSEHYYCLCSHHTKEKKKHQQLLRNMCKCCVWATSFVFNMQSFCFIKYIICTHTHTYARTNRSYALYCVVLCCRCGCCFCFCCYFCCSFSYIIFIYFFLSLSLSFISSKHSTNSTTNIIIWLQLRYASILEC